MPHRAGQAFRGCPVLLFAAVGCLAGCSGHKAAESEFLSLLPEYGEADQWRLADPPQHVVGEDLFLLINGGAEIYHEYGFEQASVQSYSDDGNGSLNLEIYEMSDPAGAYGIFTFKRGEGCRSVHIGDESCLQDYYLNVWKGRFLITVIGFDTTQSVRDELVEMGEAVVRKIDAAGSRPPILGWLPEEGLDETSIRYLRGNLGLFRTHEFGTANVFGLTEGVTARVGDEMVFVFHYESESEAARWFANAIEQLSRSEEFRDVKERDGTLSALDAGDRHLLGARHENCILMVLGEDPGSLAGTVEALKLRIGDQGPFN